VHFSLATRKWITAGFAISCRLSSKQPRIEPRTDSDLDSHAVQIANAVKMGRSFRIAYQTLNLDGNLPIQSIMTPSSLRR
jgi:hypothetical protein